MRLLALAAVVSLLSGAVRAREGAASPSRAAALQAKKLEAGKASLEKLRADPKRRRYRDGWEAVLRELDAAVKAAPTGPRAAEAALAAARARADLWDVTRSLVDARAAIAALRKVDEDYPGPSGAQALAGALGLATRAHDEKEGAIAAKLLAEHYPQDAKAIERPSPPTTAVEKPAVANAKPAAVEKPAVAISKLAATEKPAGIVAKAPAGDKLATVAVKAAPAPKVAIATKAQKPVEVGDDEEDDATDPKIDAPAREPDVDVAHEAGKVIEEMVHDAKGVALPAAAKAESPARPAPASAAAKTVTADDDDPPEDEAEEVPTPRSPPIVRAVKDAVAALTEPEEEPATAAKARELRSTALASHSSLAAQLGLKVRRVVVDAGHGGKDAGATGPHGVREKDMTLAIAKKVAARLKSLGFTVIMTRTRDAFVSLDERTRIANEAHADLFVSIHCNAARRRNLAGVETWTLNVASDRYAARLAAFENAEADRTVSDLRLILADLATKANAGDARDLAQSVQSSLVRTLRGRVGSVRDHGVKQALFYVLLGTHMPSILVETGFISNPAEEARLKSARFQEGTADAIARGVKEFVESRRRLALAP